MLANIFKNVLCQKNNARKIFLTQLAGKKTKHHHDWSYEGECGPQTWSATFKDATGQHQSPINIKNKEAVFSPELLRNPLKIKYNNKSCYQIRNTGHTFQVDSLLNNKSRLHGGPLNHEYNFLQFHMHWGDNLERGSEHLIDGHAYSGELHFVNWNHQVYETPKSASVSNKNDGLVVLGVFLKVGKFNSEFENLSKCIHDIHLKNQHVHVDHINIRHLLPENISDYWTYLGSLTTPPCSESVVWILFKDPIEISEDQLDKCHQLYSVTKERLCNELSLIRYNDRPICDLGDRIIKKTFKD